MSARRGFNPLKILVSSHLFHPSIGGLEEVSRNLAAEFVRQGNEVKLVTQTPGVDRDEFPFEIVRHPSGRQLRALTRWCDVLFHNNISLQTAWPLLVTRRPWIITHAIWTSRVDGAIAWQDRLKRFLFRFATNIAISQAIADALPVASLVIGNPFRRELFRLKPTVVRDRDLVFLGRLVSDKGVDLLLRALGDLKKRNVSPNLTIIGDGPEERSLRQLAQELRIDSQVNFAGRKTGEELVDLLNAHRVMVVPSRWREPFGVVALEGIACGCVVVGSEEGGLKSAIGPCGTTFANGDLSGLVEGLHRLIREPQALATYRAAALDHLEQFSPDVVATRYLEVFGAAVRKNGTAIPAGVERAHGAA